MSLPVGEIICGDCLDVLAAFPSDSVDCCVTSPPYWGLRDYGADGQLGLEPTPEAYVASMVAVFEQVRRVLQPAGTLWLNLGDSYAANTKGSGGHNPKQDSNAGSWHGERSWTIPDGLKPKDLIGIPWRVAFALQAAGWYLRSDIIWAKPNPMPESVTDRPTKSHEHIFLLSKSARYWYDAAAIAEPAKYTGITGMDGSGFKPPQSFNGKHSGGSETLPDRKWIDGEDSGSRNARDVWTIATEPYPGAHFATFPTELPRRCILAGCPACGVVLDPFAGSGTTGMVAEQLGRQFIGIELSPQYAEMARKRTAQKGLFSTAHSGASGDGASS